MKSELFSTNAYKRIERDTLLLLNNQRDVLSARSLSSPRAAGDAVEAILTEQFSDVLEGWVARYSADFARRAMADLAFGDAAGNYYVVDVKTHRTDTKFNMPNLTSVRRLTRFYEDDHNYFVLLLVSYHVEQSQLVFTNVRFVPIEFLDWHCLTLGALGWGQIQIANANNIQINPSPSRAKWMVELCDYVIQFYEREIGKIGQRSDHFQQLKTHWLAKYDTN